MKVRVVSRRALNGTIDGHDPLVVTFRIKGPRGWFRLTVVTVNWGRGYEPGQFHGDVMRVLNHVGEREYVVILMQEIDEADPAPEHKIIRRQMEPGTTLVQWWTREPIAVSPGVEVTHQGKRMTMDQGSTVGADGLGPRRFITFCRIVVEGVVIGIANQHPHRYSQRHRPGVAGLLERGERVTRRVLGMLARTCELVIDGGDLNTTRYPKSHPRQRVAYRRGLDYVRFIVPPSKEKP